MTEQHECWWVIRVELNGRIIAECNDPLCPGELGFLQISRRLNKYETLKRRPSIKISDGDVWLVFPDATISIEEICRSGAPGPIVKRNLRIWREGILEGK